MKKWFVLWMLVLIACTSVSEPEKQVVEPLDEVMEEVIPNEVVSAEPVTRTVKQSGSYNFDYGLSEDNVVLRVASGEDVWNFKYTEGYLIEISGADKVEFIYDNALLSSIVNGEKFDFIYDENNRLVEVKTGRESWHIEYVLDRVERVRRGVAGGASFDYDDSRIKAFSRGPIVTNVFYDDRNRVRNFDADDTKMILGYWRDDKLVSLTGKTFGAGVAVSYGPGVPAFEAKIVSGSDNSVFTAAYTDTLYKVVDEYLYCKYVRRLGLLFDGISYAFFVNYFKGDIVDYFVMNFRCLPYE